jgi:hypothetical protein
LSCKGIPATATNPVRSCSGRIASTLLTLPSAASANNDLNPGRVKPRNIFDLALGTDNLFHSETSRKISVKLTATNLTNKVALNNFLSFSGSHF